jgi:hypothetical protein
VTSEAKSEKTNASVSETCARSLDMLIAANDYLVACGASKKQTRFLPALELTISHAEQFARSLREWREALEE